ncbi:MAG: bile acid transporter family protein [Methylococcaceae bacterium NSM2-1]|nr:MAG: bile acid transporter family protein [Methylococcaceae bacterium NSM2-1]
MLPDFIPFQPETLIRALTMLSLGGLLLAVGLRLELAAVASALRHSRLALVLPLNFVLVPVVVSVLVRGFALPPEIASGMLLLAAAPFAPVVPVFVKMARGDLALAAGLTAIFPIFSTFLTPLVCEASFAGLVDTSALRFHPLGILAVLFATVTLPLIIGMALRHGLPNLALRILRPLEVLAEATGAISLAFVTFVEFGTIMSTGWKSLLAMALAGELSFLLGLALGGALPAGRQVIAFGTANRNIALALLVAVDGFAGTAVLGAVVANGLLLIFLGLLHVAYYRLAGGKEALGVR